ncbi:MAG TPA: FG-GAP-like repeat-containing protein, partial [Kofleriaceae bacterium]|nr:FG-GAP-like repeat-containing protein [Kofleriaceae bacterium]
MLASLLVGCAGGSDGAADGGGASGDAGGSADSAPGTADAPGGPAGAPRPIAPLATAMVTSARPTLHWQLGAASVGASVELCRDAAMSDSCQSFVAGGASGAPPDALAPGVWFWRLHGVNADGVGPDAGPVWQFRVGVQPPGTRVSTSYGSSVDVNGDGYTDLLVSAPDASVGGDQGRLFIYLGSATGFPDEPSFTLLPPETAVAGDHFPSPIADAGDINGDGFTDVIVGRMAYNTLGTAGTVHIYYGSADGPGEAVPMTSDIAGWGVGIDGVGDVNGDGYGDVLIGAEPAGAYVYHGGPDGLSATPATTLIIYDETWGSMVSRAGDVNGDGYGDFVVRSSSTGSPPNFPDSMVTQLYVGGPGGVPVYPSFQLSAQPSDIACGGDINGDGYSDILFGEDNAYGGQFRVAYGKAYINAMTLESLVHEDINHWWDFGAHIAG